MTVLLFRNFGGFFCFVLFLGGWGFLEHAVLLKLIKASLGVIKDIN